MPLTLTVLRCPPSVAPEVRQVTGGEFTIGRGADNDWVLPDPARQLSKRHCVVAFRQGTWLVEEAQPSWNRPVAAAKPDLLDNPFGDQPFGGNPFAADPFGDNSFASGSPPRSPASAARPSLNPASIALPAMFDPLLPEEEEAFRGPTRADHSPAISDAINLPPARSVLPDDWDLDDLIAPSASPPPPRPDLLPPVTPKSVTPQSLTPHSVTPQSLTPQSLTPQSGAPYSGAPYSGAPGSMAPASIDAGPQPVAPMPASVPASVPAPVSIPPAAQPAAANNDLLAAFLRGAGMDNAAPPDPVQTMEHLGAAFRAMVSGIRHALIARSEVKREFRIEATVIRRQGNNLLKFSANDDDALAGLLGVGRRTDMGPEETITDALTDMRLHELATMTAMQTAVRALVARLGPDQVRDAKDQGGGMALLGNRKAKAWDAYEALHAQVLRGLSDDFDSLFGKRFAQAYEQAMQELLARQRSERSDRS
jgi:type VI secretion system FHA domain protein